MQTKLGFVGLGKMGSAMVARLIKGGMTPVVFDIHTESVRALQSKGAIGASSLSEMATQILSPRVIWMMVPAGRAVDETTTQLFSMLSPGDILIDGGNSYFRDSMARAEEAAKRGITYLDAGTSGGIWGEKEGYCLMVGGDRDAFLKLRPLFDTLTEPGGYAYVGPSGAGHFVKMVHNGIEYGLMQALGEGFELLEKSQFDLDLPLIAELWKHGSVVRSWLLDLAAEALKKDPKLAEVRGYVEDSGEGRWTILEAIERGVPAGVLALSLFTRFRSREQDTFSDRLIASLRNEFGGHALLRKVAS
jgi:6-phosphogluconate dehydrogenase